MTTTPHFKIDWRPATHIKEVIPIELLKNNMSGWQLTPQEKNEFKQLHIDQLKELTSRIDAFRQGLILLNPVFICDFCAEIVRWDIISQYSDYHSLKCASCAKKDTAHDEEKSTGKGSLSLSCSLFKLSGTNATIKEFHEYTPCHVIKSDDEAVNLIPDGAIQVSRQVVSLMNKEQTMQYFTEKMLDLGPRCFTITQVVKYDPCLAYNLLLHYNTDSIERAFTFATRGFMTQWFAAQFSFITTNNIQAEMYAKKHSDIIYPQEARSELLESEVS